MGIVFVAAKSVSGIFAWKYSERLLHRRRAKFVWPETIRGDRMDRARPSSYWAEPVSQLDLGVGTSKKAELAIRRGLGPAECNFNGIFRYPGPDGKFRARRRRN